MGSCVSRSITENQHHIPNPSTPVDEREHHKLKDFIPPATLLPLSGCTDESFFDAQPWIDSDCDDEFYSTNGDYTPSPGVPRVHRRFSTGTASPLNSNVPRLKKVSSTPSRTNTPLNVIFATRTVPPQSNEAVPDKELSNIAATMNKRMRLNDLFRLSRGGFADEDFMSDDKISTDTKTVSVCDSTTADCSSFTSAGGSVCIISSKRTSNASSKSRRSIRAVHPIECLRKLRTRGHKNEKKMDANVVV